MQYGLGFVVLYSYMDLCMFYPWMILRGLHGACAGKGPAQAKL